MAATEFAVPVYVRNPVEAPAVLASATSEEAAAHLHQRQVLQLRQDAHERRTAREHAKRPGTVNAAERARAALAKTRATDASGELVRPASGKPWSEPAAILPPSALHDMFCTSRKLGARRRAVLFCAQYLAASGCPKAAMAALDEGGVPRSAVPLTTDSSQSTRSDYLSFYSVLASFQDELEVNAYQRTRPAAMAPRQRPASARVARASSAHAQPAQRSQAWIHRDAEAPDDALVAPHGHPEAVMGVQGEPLERVAGTPFLARSPRHAGAGAPPPPPEYARHEYFHGDCGVKAQMVSERIRRATEECTELDEKLKQFQYYNAYVAQRVGGGFDVGFQLVDRREFDGDIDHQQDGVTTEVGPPPTAHLKSHRSPTFTSAMRSSMTLQEKREEADSKSAAETSKSMDGRRVIVKGSNSGRVPARAFR
ncbi:hypothetical protein PPROV_000253600 [Pycnococcus provasolii]|uniref:Uncharacterized protein n=1 Tax=Pycnococcus provasolii TaxID=41880 RepID=A0A830HDY5_9CHLO|nr:hypothetical protein PPROV_000253600 [Pycnococcus provasolii]